MRKNLWLTGLKGFCVGGTMLVPGVSGGSMAMILGVYDQLISSVSSFMKHKRKSTLFLGTFALGGIIGIVLFSKPLLGLIERYPMPMLYFFMGAVAGGIPFILKQAKIVTISWDFILYSSLGLLTVLLLSFIPTGWFESEMKAGLLSVFLLSVAGFIAAIALILPGISVSYMLLILGLYDETIRAINELYFPFLIPLGVGLIVGIFLSARILEKAMTLHAKPTYLIILGFILGSMIQIFPGIAYGWELMFCIVLSLSGFLLIRLISKIS